MYEIVLSVAELTISSLILRVMIPSVAVASSTVAVIIISSNTFTSSGTVSVILNFSGLLFSTIVSAFTLSDSSPFFSAAYSVLFVTVLVAPVTITVYSFVVLM